MFNEVRVYNAQHRLKKIISPSKLSEFYWKKNLTLEKKITFNRVRRAESFSYLELLEFEPWME